MQRHKQGVLVLSLSGDVDRHNCIGSRVLGISPLCVINLGIIDTKSKADADADALPPVVLVVLPYLERSISCGTGVFNFKVLSVVHIDSRLIQPWSLSVRLKLCMRVRFIWKLSVLSKEGLHDLPPRE